MWIRMPIPQGGHIGMGYLSKQKGTIKVFGEHHHGGVWLEYPWKTVGLEIPSLYFQVLGLRKRLQKPPQLVR